MENLHQKEGQGEENLQETVRQIIQEVVENICDNYCKYRDTADEDCLCELVRSGKDCPLDRLM